MQPEHFHYFNVTLAALVNQSHVVSAHRTSVALFFTPFVHATAGVVSGNLAQTLVTALHCHPFNFWLAPIRLIPVLKGY